MEEEKKSRKLFMKNLMEKLEENSLKSQTREVNRCLYLLKEFLSEGNSAEISIPKENTKMENMSPPAPIIRLQVKKKIFFF